MTTWNFVFSIPRNRVTISLQEGHIQHAATLLEGRLDFRIVCFLRLLNKSLGDALRHIAPRRTTELMPVHED